MLRLLAGFLLFLSLDVFAAKTDSAVTKLNARIATLERIAAKAKADSVEVLRLQDQVNAMDKRMDYVSAVYDKSTDVAWYTLGIMATIFVGWMAINLFLNFRTVKAEVTKGIDILSTYVEEKTDERVKAIVDPDMDYLKRYGRAVFARAIQTDIHLLEKDLDLGLDGLFGDDRFRKLIKLIKLAKDYEQQFPEIVGIHDNAFNAMVKYLNEKEITLSEQKDLHDALDGFNPKYATMVDAIKAAVRAKPALF